MKTIIRNLLGVVRRFKVATLLNVLGLSVAFAAFIILMIQLQYDWGFDRYQKNAKRIFRVGLYDAGWGNQVVLSVPFARAFIQSSPHIEKGGLLQAWNSQVTLKAETGDNKDDSFWCIMNAITPEYATIFDFQMVEGNVESINNPGTVLLSQSQAKKFFADKPAVGKLLTSENLSITVGGVYKDFPANSVIQNAVYRVIDQKEGQDNWNYNSFQLYVLLDNPM